MMRIDKEKRKISIICVDGSSVKGIVHINPGERVLDFINDMREKFIAITNAEFFYAEDIQSFRLTKSLKKKELVILNKSSIKWIEETK
jgi:hypothetical protein